MLRLTDVPEGALFLSSVAHTIGVIATRHYRFEVGEHALAPSAVMTMGLISVKCICLTKQAIECAGLDS